MGLVLGQHLLANWLKYESAQTPRAMYMHSAVYPIRYRAEILKEYNTSPFHF